MPAQKHPHRPPAWQVLTRELAASKLEAESAHIELRALHQHISQRNHDLRDRGSLAMGVIEAISVPVAVLDEEMKVVNANRAFYTTFNAQPATTVMRPLVRVEGADWSGLELQRGLSGALHTDGISDIDLEVRLDDGTQLSLAMSAQRIRLGGVTVLVCCLEDFSGRRRAQTLLESQVEQMGSTSAGLMLLDRRQRVTYCNPAVEVMTGWREAELVGRPLPRILAGERLTAALRSGLAARGEEPFHNRQGRTFPMRWHLTPLRQGRAGVGGLVLELRDISAEERVQAALLESERLAAAGKIAAILAHEINNPLAAVSNALYLLGHSDTLDPRRQSLVDTASGELQRASEIVRKTLGMYRKGARAGVADVNQVCAGAAALLKPQITARRLRLRQRLLAQRQAEMRSGDLRQIVVNLLSNAIEASPRGGEVCLATRDAGGHGLRVLISDQGPGIAPEIRDRMFQPFFTTKGERGTGLGLWVITELARANSARLRFHSSQTAPTGTCFCLLVPAHSPQSR